MIRKFNVKVNGKNYAVEVEELENNSTASQPAPQPVAQPPVQSAPISRPAPEPTPVMQKQKHTSVSDGKNVVKAPLPGVVVDINIAEGNRVSKGQKLLVIEAMKMENEILSDYDGVVEKILVKKGDSIEGDQDLIIIS
ncbi:propionyl-CoA carboxylase [Marinitoga sp. 1197]|uniref:biotin/lipoyl-containing protein n=1 Tax=unclassified Marinitoga TaxID=2640159 RepID=UPI00064127A3|nr:MULTISPECIES: biotin/lipoyl-containing protein [unclassified Marinitoga]KLO22710.1 propionyl-CoA carboxylase [Marinitoga sp. 1197]KLO23929.1 propionyl-CoA carboxylase [Marinitoga sp. 1155]NUU99157.1 hypothetical protein [Marinitoga sp. 1154]